MQHLSNEWIGMISRRLIVFLCITKMCNKDEIFVMRSDLTVACSFHSTISILIANSQHLHSNLSPTFEGIILFQSKSYK